MLRIPSRLDDDLENLIHRIIGCCIEVHKQLGPGLLEVIYQRAVAYELQATGIRCELARSTIRSHIVVTTCMCTASTS
jgi:GxxExxY protein